MPDLWVAVRSLARLPEHAQGAAVSWFKVDDRFLEHPKARAAGKDGRALWFASGTKCAEADGFVGAPMLTLYAALAEVTSPARVAAKLVTSGLWHDHDTIKVCHRCLRGVGHTDGWKGTGPFPDGWYFHDWRDYQLDPAGRREKLRRDNDARRKRLDRNDALQALIHRRDLGLCRYCAVRVEWERDADVPWAKVGTWDHVDRFGGNDLENVVTACAKCNTKRKGGKSLAEAGMVLLPPPSDAPVVSADAGRTSEAETADGPRTTPRVARDSGRSGDGAGSVRGRLGLVGSGGGLVGLVRDEGGRHGLG